MPIFGEHGGHTEHKGAEVEDDVSEAKFERLEEVVQKLRQARQHPAPIRRCGGDNEPLPSRERLVSVVASLRAALFPAHFGPPDLSLDAVDHFVGYSLDRALYTLREQIRRGLAFAGTCCGEEARVRADDITMKFAAQLPALCALLDSDVAAAFAGDPAAQSPDEAIFCYPGLAAITHHRLSHALHRLGVPLIPRIVSEIAHSDTGIDIHPGAQIGERFFIDHGTGVVIGETCEIGKRVRIYQGVTLGAKSFPLDEHGNPKKGIPRHPIVEDDVVIYSGATILGRITIGRGSSIGGNVWLTRSVPPNSRITQAQASSEVFQQGAGI